MKITISILCLLFLQSLIAQESFYYPLAVGDRWQFAQLFYPNKEYIDFQVVSDTIMPNGHRYAVFSAYGPYQRQQGNLILQYSPADSQEYPIYDFSLSVGDTIVSKASGVVTDIILTNKAIGILFDQPRMAFTFFHSPRVGIDVDETWTIADSIGKYHFSNSLMGPFPLVGAIISGKTYGAIVSVQQEQDSHPISSMLHQNYPNPFNAQTQISFQLHNGGHTRLEIFDILGRKVRTLIDGRLPSGPHRFYLNSSNLPAGIYVYRLTSLEFTQSRAMVLAK